MKRIISFLLMFLCLISVCACSPVGTDKIKVVATVFPSYEFAKNVFGDTAEVEMILPLGSDSHYFEPSMKDIADIRSADLFIYAGDTVDPWAEGVLETLKETDTVVFKMSDYVNLLEEEDIVPDSHAHSHTEQKDEHIWSSIKNSQIIVEKIKEAATEAFRENTAVYEKNASDYVNQLRSLDEEYENALKGARHKTLIFADRFPFRYMASDYSLSCYAAFSGCSTDAEPALKTVKSLADKIKSENLPCVIVTETAKGDIGGRIAESADVKVLTLHSCHNITEEQKTDGITYIDLMKSNLEVLKEALDCR